MNATVSHLDQFLREADPATARNMERIVLNLLSLRSKGGENPPASMCYRLPSRSLGAYQGLDLTKLAHVDEDM